MYFDWVDIEDIVGGQSRCRSSCHPVSSSSPHLPELSGICHIHHKAPSEHNRWRCCLFTARTIRYLSYFTFISIIKHHWNTTDQGVVSSPDQSRKHSYIPIQCHIHHNVLVPTNQQSQILLQYQKSCGLKHLNERTEEQFHGAKIKMWMSAGNYVTSVWRAKLKMSILQRIWNKNMNTQFSCC